MARVRCYVFSAISAVRLTMQRLGKLSTTSSHLFKLILPLEPNTTVKSQPAPTVFLLHPSQPLSHVSRLILASLAPAIPTITFRSTSSGPTGQAFQWSHSTDVGDFIKDAARASRFSICISYDSSPARSSSSHHADGTTGKEESPNADEQIIDVEVPTFTDRTRFLRKRLAVIQNKLGEMEGLKRECDREAHRGAKRMAMGGFGMLIVYWGAVARLTFWDYGW
jgi:calcium uniporter protein, mitochondrial